MDMVQIEGDGRVIAIHLKPDRTDSRFAWICAAWSIGFTGFMHHYLQDTPMIKNAVSRDATDTEARASFREEMSVGHVLKAALQNGLHIQSVTFPTGSYIDIGTPHGLNKALQTVLSEGTSVSS
jgi:glucose-1-phosphate thymidylyltransferase